MRKTLGSLAVLIIVAAVLGQRGSPTTGQTTSATATSHEHKIVTKDSAPGCKSSDDLEKIVHLANADDREAAWKFFLSARSCRLFAKGERLRREDISFWNGTSCMRKQGEPDCYWIENDWLADDEAEDAPPTNSAKPATPEPQATAQPEEKPHKFWISPQ
jgi:hypothetical protein